MLFINISSYKNLLLYMIFFKNGRPIICFKIKKKIWSCGELFDDII